MGVESIQKTQGTTYTSSNQSHAVSQSQVSKHGSSSKSNVRAQDNFSTKNPGNMAATISPSQADSQERVSAQNESIKGAVDTINKNANTECIFGIHDQTNRVTIKIVDKDTKEVIKELPPEKTLDMIAKVWEMAGLFVDEKR